jgi:hypothetical protein
MKHFYIFGGCSFTAMPKSWARQLTQKINPSRCHVAAHAGAGNTMISTSVLHHAFTAQINKYTPDITVMWSHPSRFDFPLNPKESPHYEKLFNRNKLEGADFNPSYYDDKRYWLLGCGNGHLDFTRSNIKVVDQKYVKAYSEHHKTIWNTTYQWFSTLQAILLVQSVCEANGWKYRFTVYNNFIKHYVDQSEHILALYKMINWDNFTFTDKEYGGLREYTLANTNTWDDGYDCHPSAKAHTDFLDNFWLEKFPNDYKGP